MLELGTRERGGQRLAPEREVTRNWHWRDKRDGERIWHQKEKGGQRLAPEREGARNWHHIEREGVRDFHLREMGQKTGTG